MGLITHGSPGSYVSSSSTADVAAAQVAMQPLYFSGCLGWFHAPQATSHEPSLGVVLCPALGREARWTYRSLRQLADRLAAAGLPTLRFEYPGTGDSADLAEGIDPLAAWRDSVHVAVDWLRAHTGLQRVALAGLRLGGLLAADTAAARADVAAVALLAPVLSGRAYARELRLAAIGGAGESQPDGGIELDGGVLPDATLASLGKIDLTRAGGPPAADVLVMDDNPRGTAYAEQCRALGAAATALPFPGYEQMMNVATSNSVPHAALEGVVGWLAHVATTLAPSVTIQHAIAEEETALRQATCRETPVQFGPDRRLAGVLCEPSGGAAQDCAVLITNTGGDPRSGIGRFGTLTARRLAAEGVTTLRFDFAGLGDSRLPGDADGHLYEIDRAGDFGAAIDLLRARGYRRIGAAGVCTGAYHIMHAAVVERRIELLLLVNLVTFAWRPGDVLEVAQRALGWSTSRYKELMWQADTWRRLLRGQVDLRHIGTTLGRRLPGRLARSFAQIMGRAGLRTQLDQPRRLMQDLVDRGARTLMVFGFEDPGVAALEANFGRSGRRLAAMSGTAVKIERGIDHTLSRRFMQDRIIDILADALRLDRSAKTNRRP